MSNINRQTHTNSSYSPKNTILASLLSVPSLDDVLKAVNSLRFAQNKMIKSQSALGDDLKLRFDSLTSRSDAIVNKIIELQNKFLTLHNRVLVINLNPTSTKFHRLSLLSVLSGRFRKGIKVRQMQLSMGCLSPPQAQKYFDCSFCTIIV